MTRPLRIEYPGAWYHVMNRGRRSENVYLVDADRNAFIKVLQEAAELWDFRIAAYCLMSNHYHLLSSGDSIFILPRYRPRFIIGHG